MMRALAGALALVLSAATAAAGLHFVWCAPMREARLHCCCPLPSRDQQPRDAIARDCCEDRSVPVLPRIDAAHDAPRIVAAPLASVLPLWAWLGEALGREDAAMRGAEAEARAGPAIRIHVRHSVFLL